MTQLWPLTGPYRQEVDNVAPGRLVKLFDDTNLEPNTKPSDCDFALARDASSFNSAFVLAAQALSEDACLHYPAVTHWHLRLQSTTMVPGLRMSCNCDGKRAEAGSRASAASAEPSFPRPKDTTSQAAAPLASPSCPVPSAGALLGELFPDAPIKCG